jgi:F-type H+-transporting ATPase subunit epsilon
MMLLDVTVLSQQEIIFQGKANSVTVPGEQGVFEILPFHKRIISRLLAGKLNIDGKVFPLHRGIVKVNQNNVAIILEENGS